MKIGHLRTNHVKSPMGFELDQLNFSWITEAGESQSIFQKAVRVEISVDANFTEIVFDSGKKQDIDSLAYSPELSLSPRTRYYWRVTVWGNAGEEVTSETAWFETAKMDEPWQAVWITPDLDKQTHPIIRKDFYLPTNVVKARAYISGVGLYELEINGKRVGDEYFAPGYNAYNFWLQYQTYDITDFLTSGNNAVGVTLGNGWYKGRFGFDGEFHELYGDKFAVKGEIIVTLADGTEVVIPTNQDWCNRQHLMNNFCLDFFNSFR